MRRLTFLAAAAFCAACAGGTANSAPPSAFAGGSAAMPSPATPAPSATQRVPEGETPPAASGGAPPPSNTADCGFPHTVLALTGQDPAWPVAFASILDCLGGSDVRVTGWLADVWGTGWGPSGISPAWLGDTVPMLTVLWHKPMPTDENGDPLGCIEDTDCVWIHLHSPKPSELPLSPHRWVTVTGHFNDRAALTCSWSGTGEGYSQHMTLTAAIARCRSHFVVTGIEELASGTSPSPD